jgi:serine/threonine-protein kinase
MGTVYRARDRRLDRIVAIKVLTHPAVQDDGQRQRLIREARTVSSLNHPNICALYDIGQQDGVDFLVMEYLEGETLARRLATGPLPLDLALSTAIALADALVCAHASGIVHRDIKPQNVILTKTGAKLLDFGIAKRSLDVLSDPLSATETLTKEGGLVGTPQYMAPEQLEGHQVDARTDIFALGALLYEMLTGRAAFAADTPAGMIGAVLHREPPLSLDGAAGGIALPALGRIVRKCLAKDPDHRWQAAQDLRDALQWIVDDLQSARGAPAELEPSRSKAPQHRRTWMTVAAAALVIIAVALMAGWLWFMRAPIDSLAVMPFVNIGADPNVEYLSDGITENLINSLSQLPRLRVVPRSKVFRYKGRDVDVQKVGQELTVRAVLTGRIVQRGDSLNIQTDLIDVAGDSQLWGHQYNGKLAEIITVQEDIAKAVANRLRLRPTSDEQKQLTRRFPENPEAHQLYLKGRYSWNRRTRETLERATQYFQEAIDREPTYALAWAGLADCYGVYGFYEVLSNTEAIPRAKSAATKALEIDDSLAEAHASLGYAKGYEWDWSGAEHEFQRAIELNPNYSTGHHWFATNLLEPLGRLEEAQAQLKLAQDLDPLSLVISTTRARDWIFARKYDEAMEQLRKTMEMDSSFALAHGYIGLVYEQVGRSDDAIREFHEWQKLSQGYSSATSALGHAYAVAGRRSEAEQQLSILLIGAKTRYVAPYDVALIFAGLGDRDRACEWLTKAYEDHAAWMIWLALDPRFDGLRTDARYRSLLAKMRIPQAPLK